MGKWETLAEETIQAVAGTKYRVEKSPEGLPFIPLRKDRGDVYLHGTNTLGAFIQSGHPNLIFVSVQGKCPAASIHVIGDGEIIILHPVVGADKFLRAVGAKTKRQIDQEERERLATIGRGNLWTSSTRPVR